MTLGEGVPEREAQKLPGHTQKPEEQDFPKAGSGWHIPRSARVDSLKHLIKLAFYLKRLEKT